MLTVTVLDFQSHVFIMCVLFKCSSLFPSGGTDFGNSQRSKLQRKTFQALLSAQYNSIHIDNTNGKRHTKTLLKYYVTNGHCVFHRANK